MNFLTKQGSDAVEDVGYTDGLDDLENNQVGASVLGHIPYDTSASC